MLNHEENANQNYLDITPHTCQNGYNSIIQVTAHAGKHVEQREHPSTADGIGNLYKHYGNNDFHSSSEIWELIYPKIQLHHSWVFTQSILYPTTNTLVQHCSLLLYSC